jgi:chromosome segregation ATPase
MTPFTMGQRSKNDPHAARLSAMSGRIDALRADITSDKERAEQLKAIQATVERLTLQVNRAQWEKDQAEKRTESVRKQLTVEIAALKMVTQSFEAEGAELNIITERQRAQIAQLESDNSRLASEVERLQARRWWKLWR